MKLAGWGMVPYVTQVFLDHFPTPSRISHLREQQAAVRRRKAKREAEKSAAYAVSERFLKTAAPEVVNSVFPSLGAAFDAFEGERQRQDALAQMADAVHYPALNFTQPQMALYAMGGGLGPSTPSTHHHRHRHHSG
jgi:hypothetical protein